MFELSWSQVISTAYLAWTNLFCVLEQDTLSTAWYWPIQERQEIVE